MAKICDNCACYEVCIYANPNRTKDCTLWQPEMKWIPVSERLPEYDGWYMVYTKNKGDIARRTNKAQYIHHSWHGNGGRWDNVTHWMPLPEPPKEDTVKP